MWSDAGGATWTWTPQPHAEALLLFPGPRASGSPDVVAGGVDRALALGARIVGCWSAGPDDALGAALEAHGFEEGWRPHWMALDLAAGVPEAAAAGVAVTRPAEVPEWDDYGQALLTMAGARPFVARVDGALAGFAWLHEASVRAPVAGLFDVVVFPRYRRRGIGRALTLAAARAAAVLGRRALVLNATGDGHALYAALGFATLGEGRTWWRHERS